MSRGTQAPEPGSLPQATDHGQGFRRPRLDPARLGADHFLLPPQHCRERPRSMVVIEVFTPVVQRILKHNMVSSPDTRTTEPGEGHKLPVFHFSKDLGMGLAADGQGLGWGFCCTLWVFVHPTWLGSVFCS